jgi:hypothetical protein
MESLVENEIRNKAAVYSAETFVPPRDHKVSMMKKASRKGRWDSDKMRFSVHRLLSYFVFSSDVYFRSQ